MNLERIRDFVVAEFLPGQDPNDVNLDQPLVTTGIIDSVGTMRLVLFLEETFGIELDSNDVAATQLDTLRSIAALVDAKLSAQAVGA